MLIALTKFSKEGGLRKVGSCLAIFFTCAFLLVRQVLPSTDFVTITLVVLAGLVGGNAIEHALNAKEKKNDTTSGPTTPAA